MRRTLFFILAVVASPIWIDNVRAAEAAFGAEDAQAQAAHHGCAASASVKIRAAAADDAQAACEGAKRALDFLGKAGFQVPQETVIEIVERLPGDLDGHAVGCYVAASRRVSLLTYEAFSATRIWFRVPVELELYRAAVTHEVAHAMAACTAEPGRLPLARMST